MAEDIWFCFSNWMSECLKILFYQNSQTHVTLDVWRLMPQSDEVLSFLTPADFACHEWKYTPFTRLMDFFFFSFSYRDLLQIFFKPWLSPPKSTSASLRQAVDHLCTNPVGLGVHLSVCSHGSLCSCAFCKIGSRLCHLSAEKRT